MQNYMEVIVNNLLPSLLEDYSRVCTCKICTDDIKALALNNLKPLYFVSEKRSPYVKLNELEIQFRTDVIKELTKAIEIVTRHPHLS